MDSQTLYRHYGPGTPHFADDLERETCEYIGCRYALATATGSGAYFCAIRALEIGPGDEVIIPAFGWITDYAMVDFFGATPVLAEIDQSMNLSVEDFEAKITERTKAVVLIYYQGGAAHVDRIVDIAHRRGIKVFEDVAQAMGCEYQGKKLGCWGDVACYSLQNNKIITAGDGGLLVTNSQKCYELAVRYHDLGLFRDSFKKNLEGPVQTPAIAGQQWRMSELTAAVSLAQLRKLPTIIKATQKNASYLRKKLTFVFPDIQFRATLPENDLGILVAFDLRSPQKVEFFAKAYEAEGLPYGPTSWCETINRIPPVAVRLKENGIFDERVFVHTECQDARMAKLAVLPVYTEADMCDMATAAVKVLLSMRQAGDF